MADKQDKVTLKDYRNQVDTPEYKAYLLYKKELSKAKLGAYNQGYNIGLQAGVKLPHRIEDLQRQLERLAKVIDLVKQDLGSPEYSSYPQEEQL